MCMYVCVCAWSLVLTLQNGSVTPLFWVMTPTFKGHGDSRWCVRVYVCFAGLRVSLFSGKSLG